MIHDLASLVIEAMTFILLMQGTNHYYKYVIWKFPVNKHMEAYDIVLILPLLVPTFSHDQFYFSDLISK